MDKKAMNHKNGSEVVKWSVRSPVCWILAGRLLEPLRKNEKPSSLRYDHHWQLCRLFLVLVEIKGNDIGVFLLLEDSCLLQGILLGLGVIR